MKTIYLPRLIIALMCLSMLIVSGCDDEPTKPDEIEVFNQIDVTLIDSWDLYELQDDSSRMTSKTAKSQFESGREVTGYPVLVEEFYLIISNQEVRLGDEQFNNIPEEIETVNLIDNQMYTVSTNGDTIYYYDYYRNSETGVLWMTEDNTPNSYFAVDPTETEIVSVVTGNDTIDYEINVEDYLMFYIHGQGPELKLTEPAFNSQINNLTPTFTWAGNNASEYLFQVRTDTLFNSGTGFVYNETLQNNSFAVPASNPLTNFTSYYWRVKADNSDWSSIWNFGTYYIVTLSSPLNTERVCRKPTLQWNNYQGATEYILQIADDSGFTQNLIEVTTAATQYVHPEFFVDGNTYFWRVKADNTGNEWSAARYFTIQKKASLTSPAHEEIGVLPPITFEWDPLQNAQNYNIQVATDEDMENVVLDETITTNSYTDATVLQTNTEYYWMVNSDVATEWSNVKSFKTNDVVLLSEPENDAVNQGVILQLNWLEFPGTQNYALQIAEDDNFSNIVIDIADIEETSYITEIDLEGDTQYFWRVQHNSSAWSDVWNFTTIAIVELEDYEPSTPINGATNVAQLPNLNWPGFSDATYYRMQLSDSDDFNNLIVNNVGSATSYALTEDDNEMLMLGTTYYWRVRYDLSEWGETWSFSTISGIPVDMEAIVHPETPHKIDVIWYCPSGEQTAYNVERSADGTNWDPVAQIAVTEHYYSDLGLNENETFHYRVSSVNPMGNSAYSEVVQATTGAFTLGSAEPDFVNVGSGSFEMGSLEGDDDEAPLRNVTLNNDFMIGAHEITNQQYCTLLNWALGKGLVKGKLYNNLNYAANALNYSDLLQDPDDSDLQIDFDQNDLIFEVINGKEDHPITSITWKGAAAYTNWLSIVKGLTSLYDTSWNCTVYGANGYRLPTEAEWEYSATNMGNSSFLYSGSDDVGEVAWYFGNATQIEPVGQKAANGLGTFDMSGNVWEWCNDYYGDYDPAQTDDPTGPNSGTHRVIRGGSWEYEAYYLRNTNRAKCKPDLSYGKVNTNIGFRILEIMP